MYEHISHSVLYFWPVRNPELHGLLAKLGAVGAPTILFQLMTFIFLGMGPIEESLNCVEYFAGEQADP